MRIIDAQKHIEIFHGSAPTAIASCLRSLICASPGHELIAADFSSIESRMLAWLAGEAWKLKVYADYDAGIGPEFYLLLASQITGIPLDQLNKQSPERQSHGKVPDLALGFQGGVGAFQSMAKNYGVEIPDEDANGIKKGFRAQHPATEKFWELLNDAVIEAMQNPGAITRARLIQYRKVGSQLFCQLPSGRSICYPRAQLGRSIWVGKTTKSVVDGEIVNGSQQKTVNLEDLGFAKKQGWKPSGDPFDSLRYYGRNAETTKWGMRSGYGGLYAENVTQAAARDALAGAMLRLEAAGYPIVLHVHDEPVSEVPIGFGSLEEYEQITAAGEPWLKGCPIVAKGWRGKRFRKD